MRNPGATPPPPANAPALPAMLGYLFPALALVAGAVLGALIEGTDGGTALGAMLGFLAALALARLALAVLPAGTREPAPPPLSTLANQEYHHER